MEKQTNWTIRECGIEEGRVFYQTLRQEIYGSDQGMSNLPGGQGHLVVCLENETPIAFMGIQYSGKEQTATFGYFEATDSPAAVKALWEFVKGLLRQSGITSLIGPVNGNTWNQYRWKTKGFDQGFPADVSNPEYYPRFVLDNRFSVVAEYESRLTESLAGNDQQKVQRIQTKLNQEGARIRNFNLDEFDTELELLHRFSLNAFSKNYLFSEISLDVFKALYQKVRPLIDPEIFWIAEKPDGAIYAFLFAYHDPSANRVVIKTLANKFTKALAGTSYVLVNNLHQYAIERNVSGIIHALMKKDNASRNLSKYHHSDQISEYALYHVQL